MTKSKTDNELFILLFFTLISVIFWDTILIYPIKLFVVLLHEISHALIAIFSGGSVKGISLGTNLNGLTNTSGGNLVLISSAGYLGSLIVGILLFISSDKINFNRWLSTILSLIILISAVNLIHDGMIIFFSLLVSLMFYISPRYFNNTFNSLFLKFIGLTSIFYIVTDIKQDLLTNSFRETDSQIFEYLTGIPSLLVGLTWFLISVITVFLLFRSSYTKQKSKK